MPTNIDINKLIDYLKMNPMLSPKHCSNCGNPHHRDDLHVINARGGEVSFNLHCTHCGLVQLIKVTPNGPMSIQRFENHNSDISPQEFSKFAGKPSVAKDEALEVYGELKNIETINDFLSLVNDTKLLNPA